MHRQRASSGYGGYRDYQDNTCESIRREQSMTDTNEAVIIEALAVIDKALAEVLRRELVSTGEVADLLLDVRTLLTHPAASATA